MISVRRSADTTEPGRPLLGSVLEFMRLIWALDHALQKTSKRMQTQLGVTGPQRLVIRVVARCPSLSAGELAELLHVHPSTLTGILARLEAQGLLSRRVDRGDRRRVLLTLTRSGRRFDTDAEGTVEAAVRSALAELPDTKIRNAAEVLECISTALDPEPAAGARARATRARATRKAAR